MLEVLAACEVSVAVVRRRCGGGAAAAAATAHVDKSENKKATRVLESKTQDFPEPSEEI